MIYIVILLVLACELAINSHNQRRFWRLIRMGKDLQAEVGALSDSVGTLVQEEAKLLARFLDVAALNQQILDLQTALKAGQDANAVLQTEINEGATSIAALQEALNASNN